jgi:hypothetical protein
VIECVLSHRIGGAGGLWTALEGAVLRISADGFPSDADADNMYERMWNRLAEYLRAHPEVLATPRSVSSGVRHPERSDARNRRHRLGDSMAKLEAYLPRRSTRGKDRYPAWNS